jgi:putative ABC transport system permease protein
MIKNYFKIAWRNLQRNKVYSAINIIGLSLGMAVALLIGLWVADELNVNRNFDNYDRIVRVMENSSQSGHTWTTTYLPLALAIELQTKYASDFKAVAMMSSNSGHILASGETSLGSDGCRYVNPEFLDMLSLHMIRGDHHALDAPAAMIIDQSLATALFGKTDPLNKAVKIDNQQTLRVTGVYEDLPHNGEFNKLHFMFSWAQLLADEPRIKELGDKWGIGAFEIFAQLQDHVDLDKLSAKIRPAMDGHGLTDHPEVLLHPMSRWHLYGEFNEGKNTGGAIEFVKMFGLIGLFVLMLACINFMNLSTARSERRAREVGIRKAVGSLRFQLIAQFLGESLLVTSLAILLSLVLVDLALPWFNQVADKEIRFPWNKSSFWLLTACFTLITGLIAGSYPAFYLSSFNAVKVLKGDLSRSRTRQGRGTKFLPKFIKTGRVASLPRKVLVVLQFTVSIALVIGTLVVYQEIKYVRNRPMGYNRNGIIMTYRNTPEEYKNYNAIRHELLQNGSIADMALASNPTTQLFNAGSGFDWPGRDPNFNPSFGLVAVSQNYGKTVQWQFLEGRDFSRDFPSDSAAIILDESTVKVMGLKHPLGEIIRHQKDQVHVIGVIRDMVMESPFKSVTPTIFWMGNESSLGLITTRLNPAIPVAKTLALIEPVFKQYNPGAPFTYWFNEEAYETNFTLENRIGILTRIFAAFAIFISCLGLFGLTAFTAEQRTREIGVRKVLGASVLDLWGLLSKEFLLLVALSILIAMPISYYYMFHWLQRYDYRTIISMWIFVGTVGLAFFITLLTVSFQSIRASLANPVESLRSE